jgi:arginine deiminase
MFTVIRKRQRRDRSLLLLLGATFWFAAGICAAGAAGRQGVTADYERLRVVMVMSVDDSIRKSSEMGASAHPIFHKSLPPGTVEEHRALVGLLERAGVRVLQVRDLLQDAIENARAGGELEAWLRETYPDQFERIRLRQSEVNADTVLQRSDNLFYRQNDLGELDPMFLPIASMYWARDFAVSTPKGIIIGNAQNFGRTLENGIARLLFRHAKALREYPVVFDAAKEGVTLEGGDVIVRDEKTLFVGTGQRTDRRAAALLARKLDMDVMAVSMPPRDKPNGMARLLLHLDSIFNFVDRDKVVAVPFFLEKEYADSNPMMKILAGFAAQTDAIRARAGSEAGADSKQIAATIKAMPGVGWVTKFEAGTGRETDLGMKLVDYARSQGWKVVVGGGDKDNLPDDKWTVERAMYELRWQGVNVAQLGPGQVIAYAHNIHTNSALQRAGVRVRTFRGELLSMRNGGPHCLIMPLVRSSGTKRPSP